MTKKQAEEGSNRREAHEPHAGGPCLAPALRYVPLARVWLPLQARLRVSHSMPETES